MSFSAPRHDTEANSVRVCYLTAPDGRRLFAVSQGRIEDGYYSHDIISLRRAPTASIG